MAGFNFPPCVRLCYLMSGSNSSKIPLNITPKKTGIYGYIHHTICTIFAHFHISVNIIVSLCGLKLIFSIKSTTRIIGIVKAVPETIHTPCARTGSIDLDILSNVEMELSIICKSFSFTNLCRKKL